MEPPAAGGRLAGHRLRLPHVSSRSAQHIGRVQDGACPASADATSMRGASFVQCMDTSCGPCTSWHCRQHAPAVTHCAWAGACGCVAFAGDGRLCANVRRTLLHGCAMLSAAAAHELSIAGPRRHTYLAPLHTGCVSMDCNVLLQQCCWAADAWRHPSVVDEHCRRGDAPAGASRTACV